MDRSTPIYLVDQVYSENDASILSAQPVEREVYADITSVTRTEWFEGARAGLNPEFRFRMFAPDYNGEEILKYGDNYYTIYRTYYGRNDIVDLYCERRNGTDDPYGRISVSD